MNPRLFWLSSAGAAVVVAGASGLLLLLGAPGIESGDEQRRLWLLFLWTAGALAICFGTAGLLSAIAPVGVRDVAEGKSVAAAIEAKREERSRLYAARFYNFAGWTVSAGVFLIVIYFAAWLALRA